MEDSVTSLVYTDSVNSGKRPFEERMLIFTNISTAHSPSFTETLYV